MSKHQRWLNTAWTRDAEAGVDSVQALKHVYIDNNPYPLGERRKLTEPLPKFREQFAQERYVSLHSELHPSPGSSWRSGTITIFS